MSTNPIREGIGPVHWDSTFSLGETWDDLKENVLEAIDLYLNGEEYKLAGRGNRVVKLYGHPTVADYKGRFA
jgi:hypothetical protein